jgi:deoxyribodipyrimidine photo-lyase
MKINIFWFRRDLRLEDNIALNEALSSDCPVLPVFIFDTNITDELVRNDARISFIYSSLKSINNGLKKFNSSLHILKGDPEMIWKELIATFDINTVFINKDYESYAIQRDKSIEELLIRNNIALKKFKDQVIFEENEIQKSDNSPYTVFTPYKNKWLQKYSHELEQQKSYIPARFKNLYGCNFEFPTLENTGFNQSKIKVRPYDLSLIMEYDKFRNLLFEDKTSYLSPHLRFGTVSIRTIVSLAFKLNHTFLSQLIWREFFMQILYKFPDVVSGNFRSKYDGINWLNRDDEFERWCHGETGYPIVDAGMRQLNETGYMHNRTRMITAGFLCKHLLTDWRWGEAYFAEKLLDYDLSSNNGNWQWAAGTGCDAAPYFRIFNPHSQQKRFDPEMKYIRKWVPDFDKNSYPKPIVDHEYARKRAIETYKCGIQKKPF